MSQLDLALIKVHLSVDHDEHDALIQGYIDSAESWVTRYVRRDLDAEYPGGWPAHILQAARFLIGHYYLFREAAVTGAAVTQVPFAVKDLLASERDMS